MFRGSYNAVWKICRSKFHIYARQRQQESSEIISKALVSLWWNGYDINRIKDLWDKLSDALEVVIQLHKHYSHWELLSKKSEMNIFFDNNFVFFKTFKMY